MQYCKTGKFATWKNFQLLMDDNWQQLKTTNDFYIISTMWLPKWRHKKAPCDDPNDFVTTQVTTPEDKMMTQVKALKTKWRPKLRQLKTF